MFKNAILSVLSQFSISRMKLLLPVISVIIGLATVSCTDTQQINTPQSEQSQRLQSELDKIDELINKGQSFNTISTLDSLYNSTLVNEFYSDLPLLILQKGYVLALTGRYEQGLLFLLENEIYVSEYGTENQMYQFLLRLAMMYEYTDDIQNAKNTLQRAEQINTASLKPDQIFSSYLSRSSIATREYRFADALNELQNAIEYGQSNNVGPNLIAIAHNNLGNELNKLKRYEEAIQEFEKSYAINIEIDNKVGQNQNLNNLAISYKSLNDNERAIEYLLTTIKLNRELGNYPALIRNNFNLGHNYFDIGDLESARSAFQEAYDLSKQANFGLGLMYHASGLAVYYMRVDDHASAIRYATEAKSMAQATNTFEILADVNEILAKSYEALGDLRNALNYHNEHKTISDSLWKVTSERNIEEVRSQYRFEILSNEKSILEQEVLVYELQLRRQLLYLLILIILVISVSISLYIYNRKNRQIELSNAQLEKLNEEKDLLTKIIVHDLRTPLTGIIGAIDILETNANLDDDQHRLVQIAKSSANNLNNLIDGLLEISKIQNEEIIDKIAPIVLKHVCSDTIDQFRPRADQKKITLETNIADFSLSSYSPYLCRILGNLVSNALKFSPSNSTIKIIAQSDEKAGTWTLAVADEGPGFSEGDKNKAFRLFQKLSAEPTGGEMTTGIGLHTVKLLVEKLHGKVEIKDNYPKGSVIECTFNL